MKLWLDESEVVALTARQQPAAQLRALKALGYSVRTRHDGTFIVPTSQFLDNTSKAEKVWEMDFSHMGKENGKKA